MAASSVWSWKEEPESPSYQLEADSWINASDNVAVEVELTDEVKASRAEHASKLLQDLDQWTKEEEQFPDWLEEKIDLPIFEDLPPPPLVNSLDMINPGIKPTVTPLDMVAMKPAPQLNNIPPPMDMMKPAGIEVVAMKPHNQSLVNLHPAMHYQQTTVPMDQTPLMQDLLQDYTVATAAADTLTPPDSPRDAELVFTMLQEMQPHELDELVRMRVESLVESPVDSQCESESVASPSASDSCYSDPEWTMASTSDVKVPKRRRVSKPYSRTPPEEKKLRKKEQNKNAATRYRLKKKQEIEEILGEEKQLQQQNERLKTELTELGREIKYLKNLMRDLFRAKGLIK